jgi:hypothetical protein
LHDIPLSQEPPSEITKPFIPEASSVVVWAGAVVDEPVIVPRKIVNTAARRSRLHFLLDDMVAPNAIRRDAGSLWMSLGQLTIASHVPCFPIGEYLTPSEMKLRPIGGYRLQKHRVLVRFAGGHLEMLSLPPRRKMPSGAFSARDGSSDSPSASAHEFPFSSSRFRPSSEFPANRCHQPRSDQPRSSATISTTLGRRIDDSLAETGGINVKIVTITRKRLQ